MSEDTYRVEITNSTTKVYFIKAEHIDKAYELASDISDATEPDEVHEWDTEVSAKLAFHADNGERDERD